jgi:hypothetical protein
MQWPYSFWFMVARTVDGAGTQALPCDPVVTLDSDHSPFLCMPGELADHLTAIANDFARRRVL